MRLSTSVLTTFLATALAAPSPLNSLVATSSRGIYDRPPPRWSQTVETQYVDVKGIKLAYRRFGKLSAHPLVYMCNFRSTMDDTDPLLFNYIALTREVILFDNSGVGHSDGAIPDSIHAMASTTADFLAALGIQKTDLLGFSMGGAIAQSFTGRFPETINKVILAGSLTGQGNGTAPSDPEVVGIARGNYTDEQLLGFFFFPSNTSRAAGIDYINRLSERQVEGEPRRELVGEPGTTAQVTAIMEFTSTNISQVQQINVPILVTNGKTDVLAQTVNSFILAQQLPNARLHIYPDSGHAHLFQFPKEYAESVQKFLDS